jgi:hypothetical protein
MFVIVKVFGAIIPYSYSILINSDDSVITKVWKHGAHQGDEHQQGYLYTRERVMNGAESRSEHKDAE